MCHYDDNYPACYVETRPVARKPHACEECGHPIRRGDRYVRTKGLWDNRPESYAQHEDCRALLGYIADTHCGGVWVFGELREAVREHYPDEHALLGRWAAILRARRRESCEVCDGK